MLGAEGGRAFHLACNPVDTNYLAVACGDYVARVFDRRWVSAHRLVRQDVRRHGILRALEPIPAALGLDLWSQSRKLAVPLVRYGLFFLVAIG